ncbi:MAG: O-antigen ligase family protein [bacterium]|nr:O-antigen ligase family protein [bacterium]
MAYFLTVLLAFFAIFQPGVLIPALAAARPFFLIAILALLAWMVGPKQSSNFKQDRKLSYFIIGFILAQTFSILQFFYIPWVIEVTIEWSKLGIVYFLVLSQMTTEKRLTRLWSFISLAVGVIAVQAMWVYHSQGLDHPQLTGGRLSSYGAYSGANDLALIVVCAWPIVFKFIDLNKNIFLKLIPIPLLLALIYVDIRTISRAGLLGLSLVMGLSMLRGRSLGKLGRWALLIPAVVIVFILGSKMLLTRGDAQDFSGKDESVQNRFDAWYAGGAMLKSNPIIGVGSGRFPELSDDFGAGAAIQAHNTIIKVFAETGIAGGVCYLGILITALLSLYRSWRRFGKIKPKGREVLWAEAFGISLIGFCFNTQFSVKAHEWLLYLVAASALALEHLYKKETLIYMLKVEKAMEAMEEPPVSDELPPAGDSPPGSDNPRKVPA